MNAPILDILYQYPILGGSRDVRSINPISGGLSAAKVYKVSTIHGDFALRNWPESFSPQTLEWIHAVLGFVRAEGVRTFPNLIRDKLGKTIVGHNGQNWELAEWIPGEPIEEWPPNETQLIDIFELIAQYHAASERFFEPFPNPRIEIGKLGNSPGIAKRIQFLDKVCMPSLGRSIKENAPPSDPDFGELVSRWQEGIRQLAAQIRRELEVTQNWQIPILPAVRDLQTEHILFHHGQFSGVVDYGSMQADSAAADLARIGEHWADRHPVSWSTALSAYQQTRRLTDKELSLIEIYDRSSRLLAPANWIQWILVEKRHFEITSKLKQRWRKLTTRLEGLLGSKSDFLTP